MTAAVPAEDYAAILNLVASYFARVDRPDAFPAADLFAEDAEFMLGKMALHGRAAIAAFFDERNRAQAESGRVTRHLIGGIELTPIDGTHAAGRMTTVVFAGQGTLPLQAAAPSTIGDFDDVYVRTDAGWLFQRRETGTVFVGAGAAAFSKP